MRYFLCVLPLLVFSVQGFSMGAWAFEGKGTWMAEGGERGRYDIMITAMDSEGSMTVVEKYLTSVVGSEMPAKWPLEALKAQAIASRTYALKQKGNPLYDIDSTNMNQVYIGLEAGTHKTKRAVNSTRSLVLTYENKLINIHKHSYEDIFKIY